MGSNKKSSVGACKSYCVNFNSFKIARLNPPQVFTGLVSWVIIFCVFYISAALHDMIV